MKIALVSDIHRQSERLQRIFDTLKSVSIDKIFCLGDIASIETAQLLAQAPFPVISVLGNNDREEDVFREIELLSNGNIAFLYDMGGEVSFNGKRYFLTHYPDIAEREARTGKYHAVFHGHTHFIRDEVLDGCRIINPGEVVGYRSGRSTYAIYDTDMDDVKFFDIEE